MESEKSGMGKEEKKISQRVEELYRVTVTKAADEALTKIVDKVNAGFEGGRVNRAQTVSWILTKFADTLTEPTITEIQAEHFDEVALLESILRKAKKQGKVPSEFRGLLQRQMGLANAPSKKVRGSLTRDFINDESKNEETTG